MNNRSLELLGARLYERLHDDQDQLNLTIDLHGIDQLWTLKSQLTIPLSHVRGATADPGIAKEPKGGGDQAHTFLVSSLPAHSTRMVERSSGTSTIGTRPS